MVCASSEQEVRTHGPRYKLCVSHETSPQKLCVLLLGVALRKRNKFQSRPWAFWPCSGDVVSLHKTCKESEAWRGFARLDILSVFVTELQNTRIPIGKSGHVPETLSTCTKRAKIITRSLAQPRAARHFHCLCGRIAKTNTIILGILAMFRRRRSLAQNVQRESQEAWRSLARLDILTVFVTELQKNVP